MKIFRSKTKALMHGDPIIEIKLRNIAAIDGLRDTAMRQIASYQADLTDAQEDLGRATGEMVEGEYGQEVANAIVTVVTGRIKRAEEGIRQQHEVILSLNSRLDQAILDSGLTDADLSYLNLAPR